MEGLEKLQKLVGLIGTSGFEAAPWVIIQAEEARLDSQTNTYQEDIR